MAKGGKRAGAGRPKTAVTKAKLAVAAVANRSKGKGPVKAKAGIEPLELLLTAMRTAWDRAYGLQDEAAKAQSDADKLVDGPEKSAAQATATLLRIAAVHAMDEATALANQAAPYKHPRLANLDSKVTGSLTVERAKF